MDKALVLIDLQNDYFPGGKMELAGSLEAVARAGKRLEAFRRQGLPVIHIQHLALRPGASFFLPGTAGAEIHPRVQPLAGETVIQKNYPNGFRQTGLLEGLQALGVRQLALAGMMTHMCVEATTRAACDLGFECLLAHDACATRALSFGAVSVPAEQVQAAFVAALQGLYARVQTAGDIAAGL
ncbi:MAG: cysteine hydrolase [Deltaproteobacteria bacterium]|nr:cysteine hydrolase [Deltaproteobacteria bacterium]